MFPLSRLRSVAQEELQLLQNHVMCNVARCLFNSPQVSLQADSPEGVNMSDIESEHCDRVFHTSVDVRTRMLYWMYECVSVLPLQLMKLL